MYRKYDPKLVDEFRKIGLGVIETGKRYASGSRVIIRRVHPELGPYAVEVSQTPFHGWFVLQDGTVVPGYPHLINYNQKLLGKVSGDTDFYGELKYNGSNVRWTIEGGREIVATRGALNPPEFPVPSLSLSEIKQLADRQLRRLLEERLHRLMEAGYPFVDIRGGGEYVFIKMPDAFNEALRAEGLGPGDVPRSVLERYVLFFELYGWPNTILVSSDNPTRGLYPIDYERPMRLVLIDVFDKKELRFLSRQEKEELAARLRLPVAPVLFRARAADLPSRVAELRRIAGESGEEGFVVKSDDAALMFKLKAPDVEEFARRNWAIVKGLILYGDMEKAAGRALTATGFDPAQFGDAVAAAVEELRSDYPDEVVARNRGRIEFAVLKMLVNYHALAYAEKRLDELAAQGITGREALATVFRELNEYVPRAVPPAARYVNVEEEERLRAAGDPRWREYKKMRSRVLQPAVNYILRRVNAQARGGGASAKARRGGRAAVA